jgi:hypothetical protein
VRSLRQREARDVDLQRTSVKAQSPTMAKASRDNCAIFAPTRETLRELLQPIVTAFSDIQFHVEDVVNSARTARAQLVDSPEWHQ